MSKQREFYDKPLFSLANYIIWILQGGIYFIALNIPLIFFYTITSFDVSQFNIALLFICFLPFGLALGALYSTMGEIIREKDISFSSYFFNSYKSNFKSNLKLWLVQLILLTVMFVDFQYFYFNSPSIGLHIVFLILGIFILILGAYAFPINCRFELKLKDLFALSFYYSIKKFPTTILKIIITLLVFFIASKLHVLLVLFIPSILCYVFSLYDRPIFEELEKRFEAQQA